MTRQQLPLPFGSVPSRQHAADFVVSTSNQPALEWLQRWPDWPSGGLVLHGPASSGKSHLLQIWASHQSAKLITPVQIAHLLTLGENSPIALDLNTPLSPTEETDLFHLLNYLRQQQQTILIAARQPPALWPLQLPDLRSRLLAFGLVGLPAPDDEHCRLLWLKFFADRQLTLSPDCQDYLLAHASRDPATMQQLVAELDASCLANQRKISIPLIRQVLAQVAL